MRDLCTRLGIGTYGITTQLREGFPGREPSEIHRIHFVNDDLTEELFLLASTASATSERSKEFARRGWVVQSVEPTGVVEEVFCAEVEDGHAFVLEDNILTGNCFGCGVSGDVISFLRDSEHLSFVEAVEMLAGRYGDPADLRAGLGGAGAAEQPAHPAGRGQPRGHRGVLREQLGTPGAAGARAFLAERGFDREAATTYDAGLRARGLGPAGQGACGPRASPARSCSRPGSPARAGRGRSTGSATGWSGRSAT